MIRERHFKETVAINRIEGLLDTGADAFELARPNTGFIGSHKRRQFKFGCGDVIKSTAQTSVCMFARNWTRSGDQPLVKLVQISPTS